MHLNTCIFGGGVAIVPSHYPYICLCFVPVMTVTSGIPVPDDGYPSEDVDQAIRMMFDEPMKRGMCRPGYTFQYITRTCIPSLGVWPDFLFY